MAPSWYAHTHVGFGGVRVARMSVVVPGTHVGTFKLQLMDIEDRMEEPEEIQLPPVKVPFLQLFACFNWFLMLHHWRFPF